MVDDILGAEVRHDPADGVLATAVLQHVAPERIDDAVRAVKKLARRVIILRELTWLGPESAYQWAHDYGALFASWRIANQVVTDRNEVCRVELLALVRHADDDTSTGRSA